MKNISKIHGLTLSAWGMAGLVGNQISTLVLVITGNYIFIYPILAILYIIGLLLTKNL